jgi:hypothetical protein
MRFEARELPTYSEHYPASRLRDGEVYFRVRFWDQDLLVPQLDPVVFIGRDLGLDDTDIGFLYFQDLRSYSDGTRFGNPSGDEPVFERFLANQSSGVFDYEGALNELLRCSLRRRTDGAAQ